MSGNSAAPPPPPRSRPAVPLLLAGLAALAVLLTLDHPGLTVDEPLDVRPGRDYVRLAAKEGLGFWSPAVIDLTYRDNKEHPPLGRWLLGLASVGFEPVEALVRGPDPTGLYVRAGRVAPALAFALLVGLVARRAGRRYGRPAGIAAGLSLLLMPRAFAHAHLGALDTFVALTWTTAFLATVDATETGRLRPFAMAGVLTGLACLTKIHGFLLIPAVLLWTLARRRLRPTAGGLMLWVSVALAIFVACWPWLWSDLPGRLIGFLRTGIDRSPIRVLYFGATYRDVDVPWHYPFVYFLTTIPVGLLTLWLVGIGAAWRGRHADPVGLAPVAASLGWLALFATRTPVYDCERLFLPAFPLAALVIGRGFGAAWRWAVSRRGARGGLVLLFAAQAYGLIALHPFGLSYYNALVGGLPGAERLGLELTYWGDAVDDRLLDELAARANPGETAALVPTLAPLQGAAATTMPLVRRGLILRDQEALRDSNWLVVSRRQVYWPPGVASLCSSPPVVLRGRQGVWLAGLWHKPTSKSATRN